MAGLVDLELDLELDLEVHISRSMFQRSEHSNFLKTEPRSCLSLEYSISLSAVLEKIRILSFVCKVFYSPLRFV